MSKRLSIFRRQPGKRGSRNGRKSGEQYKVYKAMKEGSQEKTAWNERRVWKEVALCTIKSDINDFKGKVRKEKHPVVIVSYSLAVIYFYCIPCTTVSFPRNDNINRVSHLIFVVFNAHMILFVPVEISYHWSSTTTHATSTFLSTFLC